MLGKRNWTGKQTFSSKTVRWCRTRHLLYSCGYIINLWECVSLDYEPHQSFSGSLHVRWGRMARGDGIGGVLFSFPKIGYSLIKPIRLASGKIDSPKCWSWQEQTALADIKSSVSPPSTKAWSGFALVFTVTMRWGIWKPNSQSVGCLTTDLELNWFVDLCFFNNVSPLSP